MCVCDRASKRAREREREGKETVCERDREALTLACAAGEAGKAVTNVKAVDKSDVCCDKGHTTHVS